MRCELHHAWTTGFSSAQETGLERKGVTEDHWYQASWDSIDRDTPENTCFRCAWFEIAAVPANRLQAPWMGKGSPSKRKMKRGWRSKMQLLKGVGLLSENKKGVGDQRKSSAKTGKKCFVFLLYNTQVLSGARRAGSEVSHRLSFPPSTLC